MADRTQQEDTAMAGELLAWLDEKRGWDDEDKVCVTAGCLPVLLVKLAKDKEEFERIRAYFLTLIRDMSNVIWEARKGRTS